MYRIITLLSIILLPFFLQAQKASASVKGIVYDTISKRGLAYATLSIVNAKDSTLVSFSRADSTGKFRLHSLDKGKYLLSSSYVGYIPVWRSIELREGEQLNMGNIDMTDVVHAGNVTVNARRAPVTINNDTLEFNTENFKTQPNAVAEDLLKKLPGVTVDNDGTVRVNGQRINRVLVNGKEFFTGDPKMATRNLDADAIDKVQVFDKKSDRAEFTGVDDGQNEKAINLKLKKDRNNALFGRVTAGGGNNDRYEGQTNINKFKGDRQFSLIGMGNNTNRQGFSPDICILDVMLPNRSGFELAEDIRKLNDDVPVIFLTAKIQTDDVVHGFKVGGNDYIRKPFSMEELIVRIENVLRVKKEFAVAIIGDMIALGKYQFRLNKQVLGLGKEERKLSYRESEILKYLFLNRENVIDRRDLLNHVWGNDSFFNSRNLDVYITKIRGYLKGDTSLEIITIKGVGVSVYYRLRQ